MKLEVRAPIVLLKGGSASLIAESDTLTCAGLAASEAGRSDDVISYLESRDDSRAVATDLSVPECFDGLELPVFLHCSWPRVGVMVIGSPGILPSRVPSFLEKPYAASVLIERINAFAMPHTRRNSCCRTMTSLESRYQAELRSS